jgi:NAD(P)-dependent dehydrogenase (short-subunit alcohol dehydrogenase family)
MKIKKYKIPSLKNKTFVITGSNSGIGLFVAKQLLKNDAKVILACRNIDKTRAAIKEIKAEIDKPKVSYLQVDLMSFESINKFANNLKKKISKLDGLIHNAGVIMKDSAEFSKDGFEPHLAVNCLGPFLMTLNLLPLLRKSDDSRIVNVISFTEQFENLDPEKLTVNESGWIKNYSKSKAASLMLNKQFGRILKQNNIKNVKVLCSHPGLTNTNSDQIKGKLHKFVVSLFGQSLEKGARSLIVASTHRKAKSGNYFGFNGFLNLRGDVCLNKSSKASYNKEKAERLWAVCERLVGKKLKLQGNLFK